MIPEAEIVRLAECYDRYANALDPTSRDRKQAKLAFLRTLELLHQKHGPTVSFDDFRYEAVKRCKAYIAKNLPPEPC